MSMVIDQSIDRSIDRSLRRVSAISHTHNERECEEKLERPWPLWPLRLLRPCIALVNETDTRKCIINYIIHTRYSLLTNIHFLLRTVHITDSIIQVSSLSPQ